MTPSAERWRQAQASLAFRAKQDLGSLWPRLSLLPLDRLPVVLAEVVSVISDKYGSAAASVAADYYDELRSAARLTGRFAPVLASAAPPEQVAAMARYSVGALYGASPDGWLALSLVGGALSRLVSNQGRRTVEQSVAADPAGVKYARHASGNACAFCAMLASRGPVYGSAGKAGSVVGRGTDEATNIGRTAGRQALGVKARGVQALGKKYHDDCHCVAVPVFPGTQYEPAPYVAQWEQAYIDADTTDTSKVLASMREQLGTH